MGRGRIAAALLVAGLARAQTAQCSIINGSVGGSTYQFVACPVVMPDGGTSLVANQGDPLPDGGLWRVSVGNFPASQAVTGTFWQATQPVSLASAPTTAVTNAGLSNLDVALSTRTKPADQQHVIVDSSATVAVTLAAAPTTAVTQAAGSVSGSNPCVNPTATLVGLSVVTSGTASVQLVALSGSTKIYVCSMNVTGVSGTSPTFKLTYGTGTACATGTTTIVGAYAVTANANQVFGGHTFAVTPAGQALCYIQTGTTPVSNLNLVYAQQ